MLHLRDVPDPLHIRRVAARAQDDAHARPRVRVVGRDHRARRVVHDGGDLHGHVVLAERAGEDLCDVVALDVGAAPALRPSDEDAVVDAVLVAWI